MVRFGAVAAFCLTACLVMPGTLLAQQAPAVSTTEFKPLTFWDKVRIGGAYFTDPSYVRGLRIAYGFNSTDIPKDQIDHLIREGKVTPATVNPATGNAVATSDAQTKSMDSAKGTVLLSNSATLLGQPHSTVWVTRDNDRAGDR